MDAHSQRLGAGERVTFHIDVRAGYEVFAEAGDTGTIIYYWPISDYYTALNDVERISGRQKFNCLPVHVIPEE